MPRLQFGTEPIVARLGEASRVLTDLLPLHQDIGEYLLTSHRDRFQRSEAPDGTRWQPKRPATIERYKARGDGNRPHPLIGPSGRLGREIQSDATPQQVEIGSALIYSGVMQDGAAKGAFGSDQAGRPIPWGDIPARVWLGLSDADERNILDITDEYVAGPFAE